MKKAVVNLFNYLLYLGLRTGVMVIQMCPIETMLAVARGLGTLLFYLDARHRKRALEHLALSFPDWSPERVRRTAKQCCQHMVMLGMEILAMARTINRYNWYQYVDLVDVDRVLQTILSDRGIIIVTGHFGNWELMGYVIGALGVRTYAVARPLDNSYIERWFLETRQETGQTIISKFGATDEVVKIVENGHPLCFLADQHAGQRGVWVDFFGRPASTYKSIGLLALQMNVPIAVGGAWRLDGRFRFRAEVVDFIDPREYQDDKDALEHITARYTKGLETLIRKAPEQYLWMHRRWRDPPERVRKKLAARAVPEEG